MKALQNWKGPLMSDDTEFGGRGGSMGYKPKIRGGLHGHIPEQRSGRGHRKTGRRITPQEPTRRLRFQVNLLDGCHPDKRAIVIDLENDAQQVAGPMRSCEAAQTAKDLNKQLELKEKSEKR
jgi:hypothetical protein